MESLDGIEAWECVDVSSGVEDAGTVSLGLNLGARVRRIGFDVGGRVLHGSASALPDPVVQKNLK